MRHGSARCCSTHCCNDHKPVVVTKGFYHSHADIAPEQTSQDGCGDEGNVDCKQLGASVGDGHDGGEVEALDALAATKSPKMGTSMMAEGASFFYVSRIVFAEVEQ